MSLQHILARVTCPYCGTEQSTLIDIAGEKENRGFVTCDWEEQGCEQVFAVEINLKPQVTVWKLEPISVGVKP